MTAVSVLDFEGWAVFGAAGTAIVKPSGRDVCMAKPFLDLGDIGLVLEGVGGGRRAQGSSVAIRGLIESHA